MATDSAGNWEDKRVFVTGADGFIGSHLAELLAARGAKVRALSLYNSFGYSGWLDDADPKLGIEVVSGDVRDPALMAASMKGIDVVFHLASLIAIPYSYAAPASYLQTNVQGTLNVVQAARDLGVKRVVHTSTSEVYGTARRVPIGEDHPLQPQSPYSASKIGADSMAMSYFHAFGLPLVIARPFNTYGPRQSARAVIPTILTQALAGRKTIRLGRLDPTRDFNYVTDICEGMIALAGCDAAVGGATNIGSGSEISIGNLVKMIEEVLNLRLAVETEAERLRPESSEVERLFCDNTRIRSLTSWVPKVALRDGLTKTVEWLRRPGVLQRYRPERYSV